MLDLQLFYLEAIVQTEDASNLIIFFVSKL